jgi:hypothetical protein
MSTRFYEGPLRTFNIIVGPSPGCRNSLPFPIKITVPQMALYKSEMEHLATQKPRDIAINVKGEQVLVTVALPDTDYTLIFEGRQTEKREVIFNSLRRVRGALSDEA